jgi:hypothetical protein
MIWNRVKQEIFSRNLRLAEAITAAGLKRGIAYMTISGRRHNREVQERLASFLRCDARELWGEDYWEFHERRSA